MTRMGVLHVTCRRCRDVKPVKLDVDMLKVWKAGMYVQDAFPALSPGERELLISGTCEPCFDRMFADLDGDK